MVLLKSNAPQLGTSAPHFELPATDGNTYRLADFDGAKVLVVMFICNHCPYVKAIIDRLVELGHSFPDDQVALVAISSNDAERYPDDGFDHMTELARAKNFPFPYLYDESQEVARAYKAVCTPDFFVYDEARHLAYAGRLDDNWKHPDEVQQRDLYQAVVALLNGDPPPREQHPSRGCSIKWKQ